MSKDGFPRKSPPREGTWTFDGSFEGLVLLAHRAFTEGASPEAIANALSTEGELFALLGPAPLRWDEPADIALEAESSSETLRAFSGQLFDMIVRVWMSEEPVELSLIRLCAEAGLHGPDVMLDYGRADFRAVSRAACRVDREINRLMGLARFSPRRDGLFASAIEPDTNVLAALVPHFGRRFGREDFAIVDLRRSIAFARLDGRLETRTGCGILAFAPEPDAPPDEMTELWKRYHSAAENPARRNPVLQRRLMPRRYWRYLPELQGQG